MYTHTNSHAYILTPIHTNSHIKRTHNLMHSERGACYLKSEAEDVGERWLRQSAVPGGKRERSPQDVLLI